MGEELKKRTKWHSQWILRLTETKEDDLSGTELRRVVKRVEAQW